MKNATSGQQMMEVQDSFTVGKRKAILSNETKLDQNPPVGADMKNATSGQQMDVQDSFTVSKRKAPVPVSKPQVDRNRLNYANESSLSRAVNRNKEDETKRAANTGAMAVEDSYSVNKRKPNSSGNGEGGESKRLMSLIGVATTSIKATASSLLSKASSKEEELSNNWLLNAASIVSKTSSQEEESSKNGWDGDDLSATMLEEIEISNNGDEQLFLRMEGIHDR